jgi:hypothetical protein
LGAELEIFITALTLQQAISVSEVNKLEIGFIEELHK